MAVIAAGGIEFGLIHEPIDSWVQVATRAIVSLMEIIGVAAFALALMIEAFGRGVGWSLGGMARRTLSERCGMRVDASGPGNTWFQVASGAIAFSGN